MMTLTRKVFVPRIRTGSSLDVPGELTLDDPRQLKGEAGVRLLGASRHHPPLRDGSEQLVALLRGQHLDLGGPGADHPDDVLGEATGIGDGLVVLRCDGDGKGREALRGRQRIGQHAGLTGAHSADEGDAPACLGRLAQLAFGPLLAEQVVKGDMQRREILRQRRRVKGCGCAQRLDQLPAHAAPLSSVFSV